MKRPGRHEIAPPALAGAGTSIVDLHTHTTRSDGVLTPAELVRDVASAGVRVLAVTDHDTLGGYRELRAGGAIPPGLELIADRVRDGLGSGVTVLGSTHAGRPGLAVAVSKDLVERVHAGNLVKELSSIICGSGGGPASSATGGGKDAARLGDALEAGARAVRDKLGGRN